MLLLCPYLPCSSGSMSALRSPSHKTDLWANDNEIETLDEVEAALEPLQSTLSCLYLKVEVLLDRDVTSCVALRSKHLTFASPHLTCRATLALLALTTACACSTCCQSWSS